VFLRKTKCEIQEQSFVYESETELAIFYVSWSIISFLYDGHVLHGTSEHHNYSLTSIHRLFSRGGKYCMSFVASLTVQTQYAWWNMFLLVLYLERERLTKASMTFSLQMVKIEDLVEDFRKPLT